MVACEAYFLFNGGSIDVINSAFIAFTCFVMLNLCCLTCYHDGIACVLFFVIMPKLERFVRMLLINWGKAEIGFLFVVVEEFCS